MNVRNVNLDLIKCIACISVVGLHTVGMNNYTIYYFCDCGVPLFFMVNGYLLLSKEKVDYQYVFFKILKILKIVFAWNFIITIPVFIFRHKIVNPFSLAFDSLLQKGYLWQFWFFGTLILIYLLLPLLHKLFFQKIHNYKVACFTLMFICLCESALSMIKGYPLDMFIPQPLRLWTWLFYFLLGGFFASITEKLKKIPIKLHAALLLFFTIFNNISEKKVGLYLINGRLAEYFYNNLTSILWYTLLFTFLLRLPIKEAAKNTISIFSNFTVGIFIIHPILLKALDNFQVPSKFLAYVLFWIGLTSISFIITYIISKIPLARKIIEI